MVEDNEFNTLVIKYLTDNVRFENYMYNTHVIFHMLNSKYITFKSLEEELGLIFRISFNQTNKIVSEFIINNSNKPPVISIMDDGVKITNSHLLNNSLGGTAKTDEEAIKLWGQTGYLSGLTDDIKSIVAITFERAAKMILNNKIHNNWNEEAISIETIMFPVIRRIISFINSNKSNEFIYPRNGMSCEEIKNLSINNIDVDYILHCLINGNSKLIKILSDTYFKDCNMDYEAESCAISSEFLARNMLYRFSRIEVLDIGTQKLLIETPYKK